MTEPNNAPGAPQAAGNFLLQRIFLANASFESPAAPAIFTREWKADTEVQFNTGATKISDNQYHVALRLTVTTTNEGKTSFIAEVEMGGIFLVEGMNPAQLERTLGSTCPNILFPYVREALSDLVARGTFPQLLLQPMNFDAIYNDAKRRKAAQAEGAPQASH